MSKKQRKTDPCPCGSGQQFRYCHGAPEEAADENPIVQRNPRRVFLLVVLVLSPLAVLAGLSQGDPEDTVNRVWSPEHGHYHTLDGKEIGAVEPAADGDEQAVQTPSSEAPPGKVWSEEHGHWHDAEQTEGVQDPAKEQMPWDHEYKLVRPDGPAPEGMVWSEAHGHWHPSDGG